MQDIVSQNIDRQFAEPAVRRELENQLAVFPDSNGAGETWSRREVLSSADVGSPTMVQIEEVNIIYREDLPAKSHRCPRAE